MSQTQPEATGSSSLVCLSLPPHGIYHSCIPFVSPFHASQLASTRALLAQLSNKQISSTAEIALMRFQDRLAHYLIERAYYRDKSEWSRVRGYTFAAASRATESVAQTLMLISESQIGDDDYTSHSIVWRFPHQVKTGKLGDMAKEERNKAIQNPNNTTQIFTMTTADRWLNDFAHGLSITNKESVTDNSQIGTTTTRSSGTNSETLSSSNSILSSLPAEMASIESRRGLLAMIEYVTGEILELACQATHYRAEHCLTPFTLLQVSSNDQELNQLFRFLPIDWNVGVLPPSSQTEDVLLTHSHRGRVGDAIPSADTMLRTEFAVELDSYQKVRQVSEATSWYNNPARVREVAQRFIRGESLPYSPIALDLQKYHTRLYCYWGDRSVPVSSGYAGENLIPAPTRFSYTSILVRDAASVEWHLLIELMWNESGSLLRGRVFALDACSFLFFEIGQFEPNDQVDDEAASGLHISLEVSRPYMLARPLTQAVSIDFDVEEIPFNISPSSATAGLTSSRAAKSDTTTTQQQLQSKSSTLRYTPHGLSLTAGGETSSSSSSKSSSSSTMLSSSSSLFVFDTFSTPTAIGIDRVSRISFEARDRCFSEPMERLEPSAEQKELEYIIPHVLHFAMNANNYSSSLFLANQSLVSRARRRFTHALIDESIISANAEGELTSLMPSVLIDLITEYHSFYLPHLGEEMQIALPSTNHQSSESSFFDPIRPSKKQKLESTSTPVR